jgi:hypothetical protein
MSSRPDGATIHARISRSVSTSGHALRRGVAVEQRRPSDPMRALNWIHGRAISA